jgi:hypothetical protein
MKAGDCRSLVARSIRLPATCQHELELTCLSLHKIDAMTRARARPRKRYATDITLSQSHLLSISHSNHTEHTSPHQSSILPKTVARSKKPTQHETDSRSIQPAAGPAPLTSLADRPRTQCTVSKEQVSIHRSPARRNRKPFTKSRHAKQLTLTLD